APASLVLQVHDFFSLGLLAGAAFFIIIAKQRRDLGLGIVYCGLPVLALMIIRRQDEGIVFALWALALVWMCDIGAYFAGRTIGGPKLAPRISPNKTWAGLIGGVMLAGVFGAFMHFRYGLPMRMTLATPVLAVIAQMGDLFESALKRRAGVKDSGNILPGHGGVMDRLDGLVPVAPLAAFLVVLPHFYP
ncbi:MAG: phosphatidate cytidylyltransferase, partial [Sphingomonas bacterium]|nr:phosphatidate cytidylyltransferase [Sphingomonas bacterium]